MPMRTKSYPVIDGWALDLLSAHLPYSLPLLRRLQWMTLNPQRPGPTFFIFSGPDYLHENPEAFLHAEAPFAAVIIDYGAGRETQMWTYCTVEDAVAQTSVQFEHLTEGGDGGEDKRADEEEAVVEVFEELRTLTVSLPDEVTEGPWEGGLLLGSLNEVVKEILEKTGVVEVVPRATGKYDKWLFQHNYVPKPAELPEELVWGVGSYEDCELVVSRTSIPRQASALIEWPNVFVKTTDGTPVAWGFFGTDGSICSLHCEEAYRGRGIARRLAAKLLIDKTPLLGTDGWASADVSADNVASRAVCKSVGGNPAWVTSWVLIKV